MDHSLKHLEIGFAGVFARRMKQEKSVDYFQPGVVRNKAPASSNKSTSGSDDPVISQKYLNLSRRTDI